MREPLVGRCLTIQGFCTTSLQDLPSSSDSSSPV